MNERKVRNIFGAVCFATALALTWAGAALPERPRDASLDVCSIDDPQVARTESGAAAAWLPTTPVWTPIAGMCPVQQAEPLSSTAAPPEAQSALSADQPPGTVQNLRRADRR